MTRFSPFVQKNIPQFILMKIIFFAIAKKKLDNLTIASTNELEKTEVNAKMDAIETLINQVERIVYFALVMV